MSRRCPKCKAYRGHHHPLCKKITRKCAIKLLEQYYELWLSIELKRLKATGGE